ncbi:MAG: M1 family aminopeptidase [Flavobacteriales bacterium]
MRGLIILIFALPSLVLAQKNTCQYHKNETKNSFVSAAANAANVGNNSRSDTFDIQHYHIDLDLMQASSQQISARCDIRFQALMMNQTAIAFDLFGLTVDSVKMDGTHLTFNHQDQRLTVQTGAISMSQATELSVFYHGVPLVDGSNFGGFDFESGYWYNLGVAFQYEPHNFGRAWFPCFDNFVERSSFEFTIHTPPNYISYGNGLLQSETITSDRLVRRWKTTTEFPTYLASVAAAPYVEIQDEFVSITGDTIPVLLACKVGDSLELINSFEHLEAAFHAFEDKFGPYKWEKVGYVATPVGAMEHPGNIAYPTGLIDGTLSGESIMAHELAHHWFGNLITCHQAEEMWINEGWAEYLSIYFLEEVYDENTYLEAVRNNHLNMLNTAHTSDGGYFVLADMPQNITYGRHTYNKGADVIHSLRNYMGDSLFFEAHKALLTQYSFQDISSETFRNTLSAQGFASAEAFFDDWIFQKGWSAFDLRVLNVYSNTAGYIANIELHQNLKEADNYYTEVPLTISFYDENLNEHHQTIVCSGEYMNLEINNIPFQPTLVVLNDDDRISLAAYHEKQMITASGNQFFNAIDLILNVESIQDSALFFAQQYWLAPDGAYNSDRYILSPDRYWNIESSKIGNLQASLEFKYKGNLPDIKDFGLMQHLGASGLDETQLVLMYRADGQDSWQPYENQENNTGSNTLNTVGRIKANNLKAGDYTLAIDLWPLETEVFDKTEQWAIAPNPSSAILSYFGPTEHIKSVSICNDKGECMAKLKPSKLKQSISVDHLPTGHYLFVIHAKKGKTMSKPFIIQH